MTIQLTPNEHVLIARIEETHKNIARIMRIYRAAMGINQTDMGARMGLHQTQISALENNGTPTLELLIRAAHGLGVSPSVLLKAAEDCELIINAPELDETPLMRASN
ncbi:MAG: helix-turn-helix transcriptional regulator [Pseudomonadota bacterium]